MQNKKYISIIIGLSMMGGFSLAIPVLADNNEPSNTNAPVQTNGPRGWGMMNRGKIAVVGTVTAVSGNIITITGKQGFSKNTTANTTFTIDATNAKVVKNNIASAVANIVVGDIIAVQGAVNGTSVVATNIRDGQIMMRGKGNGQDKNQILSQIQGNGQPVVAGTVSAINGLTLTITNKSNIVYTVDATNAKITQGNNTAVLISNITLGDTVIVQGTVNGTNINASTILDQIKSANTTTTPPPGQEGETQFGFFKGIGQFFMKLFGF